MVESATVELVSALQAVPVGSHTWHNKPRMGNQRRPQTRTYTCIYCRGSGSRRLSRDHVIPLCMGRFRHNLVIQCVCQGCNNYFGDNLELVLANDSVEAVLRLRYGLGTCRDSQKLRNKRVTVRVTEQGDWKGAYLTITFDSSARALRGEPPSQAAFKRKGESEWHWFLEGELAATQEIEKYRHDADFMIAGPSDGAVIQRVVDRLGSLGFKNKIAPPEAHHHLVETWVNSAIDDVILRAVGKIAFNYLALMRGAKFALQDDFDQFRNYVRYGTKPLTIPIAISKQPMLGRDDQFYRQSSGHVVGLDWNQSGSGIVCLVRLFNHLTYHALLCDRYSGLLYFPIRTGHHFDLQSRSITNLG